MRRLVMMLLPLVLAACTRSEANDGASLTARRGTFVSRLTLTGELEARRGETISVPALPMWQTTLKWIVEDGEGVRAGERVAELAAGQLPTELEATRQSERQAGEELQQRNSEWTADLEQKRLDVDKKRAEYEKARIQATVPGDLLSPREAEERKLNLERTRTALDKASELLASRTKAIEAERANLTLNLEKTRRDIARSSGALDSLVIRAPRDGIVVLSDLPWLGRKLRQGDEVWVGFGFAAMPDLSSLQVNAWLPDVDDGRVRPGMPAVVTLDGYPTEQFRGRVRSVAAVAQDTVRMSQRRFFRVTIDLDSIDRNKMRPGLSARVEIERVKRERVLLVPRAALRFEGEATTVRLAGGETKKVSVSECNPAECVVSGGIAEETALGRFAESPDA